MPWGASALPAGTVTFLFTDLEGSTRLLEAHPAAYREAVRRHHDLLERAVEGHGGVVFETVGDAVYAAFARPTDAVAAALAGQLVLQAEDWGEIGPGAVRARMGVHTGEVEQRGAHYFGAPLYRCARLADAAHEGQVVLSAAAAALATDALPEGAGLRDLGQQRLKDLQRPERVFQLVHPALPAGFPPLRTLSAAPNNLPVQATPFVGRERQLDALCARLRHADVRLLTLTGPGGVGKTRLALQAAADVLDGFAGGVYVVSLAPLADPSLVPSAIAQALDLKASGGRPIVLALTDFLREKRLLLVLDNFEHVTAAAPEVAALLGAAPGVKALVTSRAVLHLYGEHELPVPPLALPDHRVGASAAHVTQFEAVRLFVERAQAARPDFAVTDANAPAVAELCRRLDGLPLALELAAARVRALPLPALLTRMERRLPLLTGGARDLPARQQTLRDTIAWSHDLLAPDEQALFRRLSVFRGCTLEGAEAVCAAPATQPRSTSISLPALDLDVLDGITSLVEKSLLRQEETEDGQPWYVMLETVREYAAERLTETGEAAAVQRRHILHYLRLAEAAEPELVGPQQKQWLARLEREHDNLRAALDGCCALGYAEPAFRLGGAIWWFWDVHGHSREGRERLAAVLARFPATDGASPRATLRAKALRGAATLAFTQGDYTAARDLEGEALAIYRTLDDPAGAVHSLERLGAVVTIQGDYETAQRVLREALAIGRTLGDPYLIAVSLHDLANLLHEQGEFGGARTLADEAMELLEPLERPREGAAATLTRAIVAQDEGDHDLAQRLMEQSLATWEALGDSRGVGLALANLGGLATARGAYGAAHQRLSASLVIQQDLADPAGTAFVLERFAALAAAQGRHPSALRLAGAAAALRRAAGVPLSVARQARLDGRLAPARRTLPEPAATGAWRAGEALSPDEAIAEALSGAPSGSGGGGADGAATGPPNAAPAAGLTAREREVAGLIAQGRTNRQIAEALVITEGTAANHVVHILNKLGFGSRVQIAAWAVAQGLAGGQEHAER